MKQPIQIEDNGTAGYVHYSREQIVQTIDVRPDCAVAADLDANDEIVGIEYLGFDRDILDAARDFAESKGLAFPDAVRKAS